MKSPPDRSGITFKVGALLEARDRHRNWHTVSIEQIDSEKGQVLVHYKGSRRSRCHDNWFPWNSPYLRPVERISLRKEGLRQACPRPMFASGSRVLACWTDCRFYPAKVVKVNRDDSYTVRFYDGVVQTVTHTKIKPFKKSQKAACEKKVAGSEGWEEGESEEEGKKGEEEEEKREEEPTSSRLPSANQETDGGPDGGALDQPTSIQPDAPSPAPPISAPSDRDVLVEPQSHLPTTHKYSREPLYRVIKNQPPPILSIDLDHNPFKCPVPGCTKSFRKGSLLHCHMKYYHSEQLGEPEAPRRKRSSSEGWDFLSERRKENQSHLACHHDNRELSATATEVKKEVKLKSGRERRDFLRIKLKKKKKRKKKRRRRRSGLFSSDDESSDRPPVTLRLSTPQHYAQREAEGEGSDWSTATADTDEGTPTYWPVTTETEEFEIVRCVCEVDEEDDFMIQCELCLCWQHGTCMGLYEDNVPLSYICYCCRDTTGWRRAHHFLSDPDWLTTGHMYGLSCVRENYSEINGSKISHTKQLLAHTCGLHRVLRGLQLKLSFLNCPSHPELQLWRLPWRQGAEPTAASANQRAEAAESTAHSYVSSEHCYQKPDLSWENPDGGVEEPPVSGVDWMQNRTDAGEPPTEHTHTDTNTNAHTATLSCARTCTLSCVQCVFGRRLNLLQHIESLHEQISSRMEVMERELDVLESWLDHSGELEPPDPLSRLPQLKQRIRWLLCDLATVRRLSVCR